MHSIFNETDYKKLNPDLLHANIYDFEEHWLNVGCKQMRLCNVNQLNVVNEFSIELILHIPYYYYLFKNNLLFDNKITTYVGMEPFYFFVKKENLIFKNESRYWLPPEKRWFILNNDEHVTHFDYKYWTIPQYKQIYQNDIFKYNKPLLIIHNKYNVEWSREPINYIDVPTLEKLFSMLKGKYQIVYIRPTTTILNLSQAGYSIDHNTLLENFEDFEMIENLFKDDVIVFDNIVKQNNYAYNEIKLMLYSNCSNFINVQGGNSHFASCFIGKILIYQKLGIESSSREYEGWYKKTNDEQTNKVVKIVNNFDELINFASDMYG